MKRKYRNIVIGMIAVGLLSGCQEKQTETANTEQETSIKSEEEIQEISDTIEEAEVLLESDMFTDRDKEIGYDETSCVSIQLSDDGIVSEGENVSVEENTVTIQGEGTYLLTGSLSNGQIIINGEKTDNIHLILDGVSVACADSAALYIKQADKVVCTLVENTTNIFSNEEGFSKEEEDNVDAAVFSKDDLTWNGTGTLTIQSQGNGITSKNDLVFTGGEYEITSEGHGLEGKESVRIAEGDFSITSGKDGIHAEDKDDTSQGFLYIADGTFVIHAQGDGMDAATVLQMDGGEATIVAGGGSSEADLSSSSNAPMFRENEASNETEEETVSTKGLKAGQMVRILQGNLQVDTLDDALHSNGDIVVESGTFSLSSGDDAIHGDNSVTIRGGDVEIPICYEGIEAMNILIEDGNISLTATDDGINAAGGEENQNTGGFMEEANENNWIRIEGGTLIISADGDGIDSNGNLYVTGGEIYISGPTSGGDGSLDVAGTGEITGGVLMAVAQNGMEQNFGDSSTQGAILVTTSSTMEAGSVVKLQDNEGNVLTEFSPIKTYNSILVSCPQLASGNTYTIMAGEETITVEMTDTIYGSGMTGGKGSGGNGGRNGKIKPDGEMPEGETLPEGMEIPEGETPPERMEIPEGETLPEGMERPNRGMLQDRNETIEESDSSI